MAGKILTAEQIEQIVSKAVERSVEISVKRAFHDAGLSLTEEDHVMEARKDFLFLRSIRQRLDGAANKIGMFVILAIVSGMIGLVWNGFKLAAGR
jgi:hypothetical protein